MMMVLRTAGRAHAHATAIGMTYLKEIHGASNEEAGNKETVLRVSRDALLPLVDAGGSGSERMDADTGWTRSTMIRVLPCPQARLEGMGSRLLLAVTQRRADALDMCRSASARLRSTVEG
jgi:hypothetical protein